MPPACAAILLITSCDTVVDTGFRDFSGKCDARASTWCGDSNSMDAHEQQNSMRSPSLQRGLEVWKIENFAVT